MQGQGRGAGISKRNRRWKPSIAPLCIRLRLWRLCHHVLPVELHRWLPLWRQRLYGQALDLQPIALDSSTTTALSRLRGAATTASHEKSDSAAPSCETFPQWSSNGSRLLRPGAGRGGGGAHLLEGAVQKDRRVRFGRRGRALLPSSILEHRHVSASSQPVPQSVLQRALQLQLLLLLLRLLQELQSQLLCQVLQLLLGPLLLKHLLRHLLRCLLLVLQRQVQKLVLQRQVQKLVLQRLLQRIALRLLLQGLLLHQLRYLPHLLCRHIHVLVLLLQLQQVLRETLQLDRLPPPGAPQVHSSG